MSNRLVIECVAVLQQGAALLEKLDDALYREPRGLPARSGVGVHFRHCLEFYDNFLAGVAEGRVDYQRRERDPQTETDRDFALTKIAATIDALENLAVTDGAALLLVRVEDAAADAWCHSSVGRELQALLSHTIHHYALIALMLRLNGIEPEPSFGVAPSTLAYWGGQENTNLSAAA
jgi:uncharacterized damage-inducible protein DinB